MRISAFNPHTTGYLNCHIADTVNYIPFGIDVLHVVVQVEVFDEHGIKLHLVRIVDKNDLRGCRM